MFFFFKFLIFREEYPELPKIEPLKKEDFSLFQDQIMAEKLEKEEEKQLDHILKSSDKKINEEKKEQEEKQYFLSDYIFGDSNANFDNEIKKNGNGKKNKKNKKIILFSNSINHY